MSSFLAVARDVTIAGAFNEKTDLTAFKGFMYCCPDSPDDLGFINESDPSSVGFLGLCALLSDAAPAMSCPISVPALPSAPFAESSREENDRIIAALSLYGKCQECFDALPRPLLISCKSNRRAGFFWAVYNFLENRGGDIESAAAYVEECKDNGLGFVGTPQLLLLFHTIIAYRSKVVGRLLLRQLFDKASSTYTYLLADTASKQALLIDPVKELAGRDAKILAELGLTLVLGINTHVHADHITGTGALKALIPSCQSAISRLSGAQADVQIDDCMPLPFGSRNLFALATPGHTNGCTSFVLFEKDCTLVFSGDALLIRGCGRTDFQQGSAENLYDSVHNRLFTLPKTTLVYPAHNYEGISHSTIAEEMAWNPRLTSSRAAFVEIMAGLNLPPPAKLDEAVPANLVCGV